MFKLTNKIDNSSKIINTIIGERNLSEKVAVDVVNSLNASSQPKVGVLNIMHKIGVDPVSGGNIRKTSDVFFKDNNEKFDLIFIDGLHIYNQVKKDILNSIKFLNDNGLILVHDCMPDNLGKQAVPRYKMQWNGDVWKAIVDLRQNENLEIFTCEMDQGIGIIQNKKNTSILKCTKPINELKFKDYYENYKEYLRVISLEELKKIF